MNRSLTISSNLPTQFGIDFQHRFNDKLSRDDVYRALADVVAQGGRHKTSMVVVIQSVESACLKFPLLPDLSYPDYTIMVHVIKVCL